jgi:hypothetical protein
MTSSFTRADRIVQTRAQLVAMRAKFARLADAIRSRQEALSRLEASAVLDRPIPPARPTHEQ